MLLFIEPSEQRLGHGCGVWMGDALIISGWWVFNESRSGVGSVVVLTLFKRLAHACLGFVPTGYIINEPSRQVARTLAQPSQKSAFEPEKRGTVAFVRKGSWRGQTLRSGGCVSL